MQDIFNNNEQDFRQAFETIFMTWVIKERNRYFGYPPTQRRKKSHFLPQISHITNDYRGILSHVTQ